MIEKDETFGDHFSKMMENLLKDLDIKPDILYSRIAPYTNPGILLTLKQF